MIALSFLPRTPPRQKVEARRVFANSIRRFLSSQDVLESFEPAFDIIEAALHYVAEATLPLLQLDQVRIALLDRSGERSLPVSEGNAHVRRPSELHDVVPEQHSDHDDRCSIDRL